MTARGEKGERPADLDRRLANAMLPEGGTAHVEELSDPYLLWFWNSNVRSTAIALGALVRSGADPALEPRVVRWLMKVREKGRWGNTQENAWAMESLVDYYRARESDVPGLHGGGGARPGHAVAHARFQGRSSVAQVQEIPQAELSKKAKPGERDGAVASRARALRARCTTARATRTCRPVPCLTALDQGFGVERTYAPSKDEHAPGTRFQAGELVKVTLRFRVPKERRYVAVEDPLPAGFEPVESGFATTAQADAEDADEQGEHGLDRLVAARRLRPRRAPRRPRAAVRDAPVGGRARVLVPRARDHRRARSRRAPRGPRRCTSPRSSAARRARSSRSRP